MDVIGLIKNITRRFNRQALYQGKRTVDGSWLCVARNIRAVCESLKREINEEIGVVPVVDEVPVSYKELQAVFFFGAGRCLVKWAEY